MVGEKSVTRAIHAIASKGLNRLDFFPRGNDVELDGAGLRIGLFFVAFPVTVERQPRYGFVMLIP